MLQSVILQGKGATEIVVFPYFLAEGTHVAKGIPLIIASARENHPSLAIMVTPHLGIMENMSTLILWHIQRLTPSSD